jgi:hypothetical protein
VERVMANPQSSRITVAITIVVIAGITGVLETTLAANGEEASANLIQRIVAQTSRGDIAWSAVRDLKAGTRSGGHTGWMQVETTANPGGPFKWTVIEEGGSERTRNKVFRELLRAEQQAWESGRDDSDVSRTNYQFGQMTLVRPGEYEVEDSRLVDGTLTVSADGCPILLQGKLAKSPSFWVKSVTVVKRFGRFDGISLPTTIESIADLKMFGQANFTMHYSYREVNGHTVPHTIADAPRLLGPSPQLIALHAAISQ